MKRLVICCDGTWNRADTTTVTNIEKIARTVQVEPSSAQGVQQMVMYLPGVGTAGYQTDKILGGAFGLGLFHHVLNAYRFLALNYRPGDQIFLFGFSRGAYTARSLAGMVGKVGLLTREALIDGVLRDAGLRYRHPPDAPWPAGWDDPQTFRAQHCHREVPIHFLGVFDTVGALGVPGALSRRHQFHDVRLGPAVRVARQALAIDEPRMKFEPCLWEAVPPAGSPDQTTDRIKQVWFEGCHSDVGGGYAEAGLSDTALLWMATEAQAQGLVFDTGLFRRQLGAGTPSLRHDPSRPLYRLLDTAIRVRISLGRAAGEAFSGTRRRLHRTDCEGVLLASTAADRYNGPDGSYRPPNLVEYAGATRDFADVLAPAIINPSDAYDALLLRFEQEAAAQSSDTGTSDTDRATTVPSQPAPQSQAPEPA
jgi:hypothetical protein